MKQAIVTGAGQGLGAAIAAALDVVGYRVGVLDVDAEQVAASAAGLQHGVALVADVTDEHAVAAAFETFAVTPDLLVNNAGIVRFGPLQQQSVDDYRQVLNINLLGGCICARQAAQGMLARGSGHIVNITSVNGRHPAPEVGVYGASKAALAALTQLMAIEWGPRGVRANAVAPGFIDAGMSKPIYANPEVRELRGNGVPLRRLGEADDIAQAIVFLDSAAAGYISGHELVVDGGVINSVFAQLPRE